MKEYTIIYTGDDNKSHFKKGVFAKETKEFLGDYTDTIPVSGMQYRQFPAGLEYPRHTAPQRQYIIYLDGEVEVEVSNNQKKIFKAGDILFATDTHGEGHVTRTLTEGCSVVVRE